ncbi:MarR family winged helix-turn-helix transcriptional regulator [Microvirga arabica]|uniref:MarR family winged helix-turn-helix transcriptional regulator n=1 Tax=Microvirga arabica TaxID=1128671 RepID=A0ABV6YEL5_9HYPH|nr:MarR family winged helix-turn-helix transcriptional regulator [Microvirga arabica]MBM1173063.1 winged helix-turn-helix transcriptional regulator [Microvirga arabica]
MSNEQAISYETTHLVRDTCLCLHAQRAARALSRRFDEALRPTGITSGQFSLLNALNRPKPPPIGPVAQLLAMDRTTLTAALKPLERDGLVTIARDPEDRRNRLLGLTDRGREVLAAAVPIWRDLHAAIEAGLPEVQPEALRGGLRALSQAG